MGPTEVIHMGKTKQECCSCLGDTSDPIETTTGEVWCTECWEDMIQEWDENHRWDNY